MPKRIPLLPESCRFRRPIRTVAALLTLAAFAQAAPAAGETPVGVVVASIFPLAAIVREVALPGTRVVSVLPPGANPHSFEPTPSQVWAAAEAALVVRIGLGFDDWVLRVLDGSRREARTVVASEGIDLIPLDTTLHEPDGDGDDHEHGAWDPHLWMDPWTAGRIAARVAEQLALIDPANSTAYREHAAHFEEDVRALDSETRSVLSGLSGAPFVGTHAAWAYLARRYDLRQVAVLERSPGRTAGPRYLLGVAEEARRTGARAVFAEVQLSQGEARIISEEAGIPVVLLDPLGGAGLEGRATYADLIRWNTRRIADAMRRDRAEVR